MLSRPLLPQIIEPGLGGLRNRLWIPERRVFPAVDVLQHDLHPLLEAHFGLPAEHGYDLADVRKRAVRLPRTLGHIDYLAAEELHKLFDGSRIARAQIEAVAGVLGLRRGEEGLRHVGDVHEIAPLGAVADDGERSARQLLAQEHAEYGPVRPGSSHPRSIGIEDADRVCRKAVDLVPVQERLLALVFR